MSIRRIQIKLIELLVLLLPYHYLVFAVILREFPILKLWRDIVMIVVVLLDVPKCKFKLNSSVVVDFIFTLITIIYIFNSPNIIQAIQIARVYILPMFLFHVVQNLEIYEIEIKGLLQKIYTNTIILCVYGLFQALVLGESFLIRLGYGSDQTELGSQFYLSNYSGHILEQSIQRVVSTFSSANICSFYFCIIFIVFMFVKNQLDISKRKYNCFMILVGVTIVFSFSRSSWLALGISIIIFARKEIVKLISKMRTTVIVCCILIIGIFVLVPSIRNSIIHVIMASFSGSDTSIISHFMTINNAKDLIRNNPFGLGLGQNGPRALNYGASNLVESSIYLMVFEYGIIGALVYFYDYIYIFFVSLSKRKCDENMAELNICIVVFVLIAFINIPYVQEIECTAMFYIMSGLVLKKLNSNRSREKKI